MEIDIARVLCRIPLCTAVELGGVLGVGVRECRTALAVMRDAGLTDSVSLSLSRGGVVEMKILARKGRSWLT